MEELEIQQQMLNPNGSDNKSRRSSWSSMYSSQIEESKYLNNVVTNIFDQAILNFNDEFQSCNSRLSLPKNSDKHIEDTQNEQNFSNLSEASDNKSYSSSPIKNVNKLNTVSYDDKQNLSKDNEEQAKKQDGQDFNNLQFKTTGEMIPGKCCCKYTLIWDL